MTLPSRQHLDAAHPPASSTPSTIIAYGVLFLLFIYYMLQHLDFSVSSIPELAWNTLVYITPAKVISFLHPSSDLTFSKNDPEDKGSKPVGFARKSEAMRYILGLNGKGTMTNVQRVKSLPSVSALVKRTPSKAPPGLGNWDNSCYQNSILQGLASLRSLPNYLDQYHVAEAGESMAGTLRDLLSRLNDGCNAGRMFWTPAVLKSMSSWQQQDAQEYFSKVLDEVEKELSNSAVGSPKDSGLVSLAESEEGPRTEPGRSSDYAATSKRNKVNLGRVTSLPQELASMIARNPLEGLLAQRVGCLQCGYVEGLSLIPFNCLTVPLGRDWMYDIRSCLDEYTGLESIDGVECAKCTLLHTRKQLERLLTQVQARNDKDGDTTPTLPQALKVSLEERLTTVNQALADKDFSDNTLSKKCHINSKTRVSTTKSRQAVIARAPTSLVIHVNRSVFDELTGAQTKNFADVRFPYKLDLSSWCLGGGVASVSETEQWTTNPAQSMLSPFSECKPMELRKEYELRAVVTHYGRHENGHYICYRKYPSHRTQGTLTFEESKESWWRLSDEDVSQVSENAVLLQGGVFMLFYEQTTQLRSHADVERSKASASEHHPAATDRPDKTDDTAEAALELLKTPRAWLERAKDDQATTTQTLLGPDIPKPVTSVLRLGSSSDKTSYTATEPPACEKEIEANDEAIPESTVLLSTTMPSEQEALAAVGSNALELAHDNGAVKPVQPHPQKFCESPDSGAPGSEIALHPATAVEASKENRQVTSTVRASPPRTGRGSVRRGSKSMGQVSSMVTAN